MREKRTKITQQYTMLVVEAVILAIGFLSLFLSVPSLLLVYRLLLNKLFSSVFNLHSVFMFLLTAVKTPLSVVVKLSLMTGAEQLLEFSCSLTPLLEWVWGGSMLIGVFYALLFKYTDSRLVHLDVWDCSGELLHQQSYDIQNQRVFLLAQESSVVQARKSCWIPELVLYGERLLAPATPRNSPRPGG